MNPTAKYLFDLNGFIVVRNVFTAAEIAAANAVLDKKSDLVCERNQAIRNTASKSPLAGNNTTGRMDLGRILEWGKDSALFRSVLDHPKLRPYYHELLGVGYRMDHQPFCILQNEGSEGFSLHGGTIDCRSGEFNPHIAYNYQNGKMYTHLLAVSVALCDVNAGDGGFVVVPGSHKSNFAAPVGMIDGTDTKLAEEFVRQPELKAGDVLMFSEGTVHGARAWTPKDKQRRAALFRFAPPTCAYGRSYHPAWPESMTEGMTPAQLAVLQPPFATRADRKILIDENEENDLDHIPNIDTDLPSAAVESSQFVSGSDHIEEEASTLNYITKVGMLQRNPEKKLFDKKVFGTEYF